MAQKMEKTEVTTTAPSKQRTAAEIKEWYQRYEKTILNFEKSKEALKLVDPAKSSTRTYTTFSKEKLRTYMKNPISNYKNLINLSRYLYYRSSVYRRLIWFNATMIDPNARSVIPLIDLTKDNDPDKILKNYYQTLSVLENMNLSLELLKAYVIAWREDVFYGCAFYDDTGYFILPLDFNYCKITGAYATGDLSFAMDMTYFSRRQEMLEWLGAPFDAMYRAYESDTTNGRWQPMPDENCVCFKVNIDDYEVPLVPYMSLFNSLINLSDLEDIQAIADEQQIYKLITATIPLISGSDQPDDWAVDPDTALEYYAKMVESLPDYIGSIISPIELNTIDFTHDQANDVNKIENATKNVFNTSGGAQILNSSTVSGTTAWTGAIKADMKYAQASLLGLTQAYLNRFLSYQVSNPAKVKLLEVSPYTREEFKKTLLEDATYGMPTILAANSLNGFSELETLSLNFLEHDILKLSEKLVPLQSSHTQSGDKESGGQEKPASELTDDGESSRETKRDNKK